MNIALCVVCVCFQLFAFFFLFHCFELGFFFLSFIQVNLIKSSFSVWQNESLEDFGLNLTMGQILGRKGMIKTINIF